MRMRCVFVLCLALLAAGCAKGFTGGAADFAYKTFDGKDVKLSSHAGKPLVLNFWADW